MEVSFSTTVTDGVYPSFPTPFSLTSYFVPTGISLNVIISPSASLKLQTPVSVVVTFSVFPVAFLVIFPVNLI